MEAGRPAGRWPERVIVNSDEGLQWGQKGGIGGEKCRPGRAMSIGATGSGWKRGTRCLSPELGNGEKVVQPTRRGAEGGRWGCHYEYSFQLIF